MVAGLRSTCAAFCIAALTTFSNPLSCGSSGSQPPTDTVHAQAIDAAGKWLRAEAVPFATAEPSGSLDDLEPLRQIVGSARVVSLGEATHGTSEFFKMKHRLLRFLVERMGFTAFAIEATWPEANRVNRYVHTGEGDPAVLLSGLYFWTWNTQEVLDMIQWMRAYNRAGGNVSFYGFDMQYPGMAIDNITKFVARVDPNSSADVAQHLGCLQAFANNSRGVSPTPNYTAQPQAYRDACRQDLLWVKDALTARQVQYETASSHDEWAVAAQSATVAIQYEEMSSNRRSRDAAMADNVTWLVDQMPPDGKIVLWAHNGHVNTTGSVSYPVMGDKLRTVFGQDMVTVGFDFARGTFNAYGSNTPLTSHRVDDPPKYAYEDYFLSAGLPRFILGLRGRDKRTDTPSWLAGPSQMRSIGAIYNDSSPSSYLYAQSLPRLFDAVIFFADTSASHLLPFLYPPSFDDLVGVTNRAGPGRDIAAPLRRGQM